MKLCLIPALCGVLFLGLLSCHSDAEDTVTKYYEWNDDNVAYFKAAMNYRDDNGDLFYEVVRPDWDTTSCILMHYFERGEGTESPYYTSFVKVCYKGMLIDDNVFDSSHASPSNPLTAKLSTLIDGWAVALERMHTGDSCRIVVPQNLGYGSGSSGRVKPYSTLIFDIKLLEITRQ